MKVIDSTGIDVGPTPGALLPLAARIACRIVEQEREGQQTHVGHTWYGNLRGRSDMMRRCAADSPLEGCERGCARCDFLGATDGKENRFPADVRMNVNSRSRTGG